MGARKLDTLFLRCKHRDRFKGKLIDFSGGQIANATVNNKSENFTWDGLALLKRDATTYLNEPAVTGGNPVAANGSVMFNDMLGTTQGTVKDGKYSASKSSLFGEFAEQDKDKFFTGKPNVDGIGYAFLFRSYRPELAKWQTSDPLGYPDGFNNFAYGNNQVVNGVDTLGTAWVVVSDNADDVAASFVTKNGYQFDEWKKGMTPGSFFNIFYVQTRHETGRCAPVVTLSPDGKTRTTITTINYEQQYTSSIVFKDEYGDLTYQPNGTTYSQGSIDHIIVESKEE